MASLAIVLLLLARLSGTIAVSPNYYISRSIAQMVIASVAPLVTSDADGQSAQPFLTSPSGSYATYLRRAVDDSAGGIGGDTCYVQIRQAGGGGRSVWESDCTPVGGADACDLAFSPVGLELFAGGHSLWDTGVDDADPATLSLDDDGDMSILSKEGVTVWKANDGEPWTGRQCGAPPLPPASSSLSVDTLPPPPSTTSTKLVTPPVAGSGSMDFYFGDQLAPPPPLDDTVPGPDFPAQPPVDTAPEQPLPPPPAGTSPDLPDPSLPPPPAYVLPDQPLYSSPPPTPVGSGPQTSLPPYGFPLAPPPAGTGETSPDDTPLPGATAPSHGEPGGVPFSTPSPVGVPHNKQGSPHHDLPFGSPPPLPDTLAPSGGHHGGGAGLPYSHGQPQQGVFGQQPQLLDGEGHPLPLEDISGGWSKSDHGIAAMCVVLAALVVTLFGF